MTTPEELKAEIERLKRDNEALKKLKQSEEADNAARVTKLQELQTAAAAASRVNGTEKQHPNELVGPNGRIEYPWRGRTTRRPSGAFRVPSRSSRARRRAVEE
jgi:septal ring factor EnvC (AmiA/AmiB activator)